MASRGAVGRQSRPNETADDREAQQEARVKQVLSDTGLKEDPETRPIPNVTLAPAAGEFCGESLLGLPKSDAKPDKGRLADIVLRLWDHRLMPIECKVSNSSLNSLKRLNNDAAVKAGTWKRDFGLHPGCADGSSELSVRSPQSSRRAGKGPYYFLGT